MKVWKVLTLSTRELEVLCILTCVYYYFYGPYAADSMLFWAVEASLEHGVFSLVDTTQWHRGGAMVVKSLGSAELPVFIDWLSYSLLV